MRHRSAALTLAAMLAALSVTGCASEPIVTPNQEQVEITLSWWGNDARNEYTLAAVQEFGELHPEINVRCSYSEWTGYEARSRVQMVSDTEADVMQINFGWLSEFSADGKGYYDLGEVSDIVALSNYSDQMLAYGEKEGILNAVPIAMNAETVYINKTIYDRYQQPVPKTWDDLIAAAKAMREDDVYPIAGAAKSIWLYTVSYAEQVLGKPLLTPEGRLNYSISELQVLLEFYDRMVDEKVFPQVEYFERYYIDNGTYAGAIAWVSDANNYFSSAVESGNEIVIADYTAQPGQTAGTGWYAKPATMYAISKNTEHPKEAAILLDFLLNSPEMARQQGVEKGIPLSRSARETLEAEDMLGSLQYDASLRMEACTELGQMNAFIENASLVDQFVEACNLVVYDKMIPNEAAREFYKAIKAMTE